MILKGEWNLLRRTSAFWISVILASLCLCLGTWNGVRRWVRDKRDAESIQRQVELSLSTNRARLLFIDRAISAGHPETITKSELAWGPRQTLWVDAHDPPTSYLPAAPLGFLATGRSDIEPHSYVSSAWRGLEPNTPTTDDPLRLLIGDFDLKFVIVDILPLLILLLCFDLVATEREDGTLRLILAQPVSFRAVLLTRAVLRAGVVVTLMLLAAACGAFATHVFGGRFSILLLSCYVALSVLYLALWAALAVVMNTFSHSSTANSLTLGSIWLFAVILVPGAMPVLAEAVAPTPSRALYVDAARAARLGIYNASTDEKSTQQQQGAMLQGFLQRHPEWANRPELSRARLLDGARGEEHSAYLKRITERFDGAHAQQRKALAFLNACSPALLQDELLALFSGNSDLQHRDFLKQSISFFAASKAYFWPRIFREEVFLPERFQDVPRFHYQEVPRRSVFRACVLPARLHAVWTLAISLLFFFRLRSRPVI